MFIVCKPPCRCVVRLPVDGFWFFILKSLLKNIIEIRIEMHLF
jgi:hypothetical protein